MQRIDEDIAIQFIYLYIYILYIYIIYIYIYIYIYMIRHLKCRCGLLGVDTPVYRKCKRHKDRQSGHGERMASKFYFASFNLKQLTPKIH